MSRVQTNAPRGRAVPAQQNPPAVRASLATMERLLRTIEHRTYQRIDAVFDDWVDLLVLLLDHLPLHLADVVRTGHMAAWPEGTTPEQYATFARIQQRYGRFTEVAFQHFSQAAGTFFQATGTDWFDWLGALTMSLGLGGNRHGDYYTPWDVAQMMAQTQNISSLLHKRMLVALRHPENHRAPAVALTGLLFHPRADGQPTEPALDAAARDAFLLEYLIPTVLPFFEPVTVCDPACGSGVMLLAAASTVPHWARQLGMVQFYGMDLSHRAVQMSRAQLRAYGLNGYEARMFVALDEAGGWDAIRERLAQAAPVAPPPPLVAASPGFTVVPRQPQGHLAHPTLAQRAAAQAKPSLVFTQPQPTRNRRGTP
ncbi:MAG: hypothetical protein EI684_02815 [Candidatus Viridilinea halotolerans]|uniref:DNA methylase adenine-specific domain-containing protein n=1 Tax=Candidatus Viridilinea halotolerans TaxID=2491704 RepID=A0A426U8G4_9CHLR|nr:MAG: hypothetical protein EI684_02815 [Candidatus Viridilinea halotolerans]